MARNMGFDSLYRTPFGRLSVRIMRGTGIFRLAGWYLSKGISKRRIGRFIRKNGIDMTDFRDQEYRSFAEFFARKKDVRIPESAPNELISPCDGLLTYYPITADMEVPMKGSHYRLTDIIPDPDAAERLKGGLCLVFRLRSYDYHHFCAFDDAVLGETRFIEGELNTVQPIACERYPIYRLNRRWWTPMKTEHFGYAVQTEIGAMVVGGVTFAVGSGKIEKGSEMGNFELSGSTITVMLSSSVRDGLRFGDRFVPSENGACETEVGMGEVIGAFQ